LSKDLRIAARLLQKLFMCEGDLSRSYIGPISTSSVGRHGDIDLCRIDGRVRFLVRRAAGDGAEHCPRTTGLSLCVPRPQCARLEFEPLRLNHPELAQTIVRVLHIVQRVKVRITPEPSCDSNYTLYFTNQNYNEQELFKNYAN